MLSHNQTKLLTALQVKKYRQKYRKFVVEGDKMVTELLGQSRIGVSAVFATERWAEGNAAVINHFSSKTTLLTEAELKKVSSLTTPNAVLAIAEIPEHTAVVDMLHTNLCFYLDGLQDPGNVGTILRIADWFGLPAVFCSPDCADVFSPKVVQASMGAIFRIRSSEEPLIELLRAAPGTAVMGAVLGGDNVFQANLPDAGLLVIGNEGRGISPEVEALLTHRLTIPRHPHGGAESLNAAVAAGILVGVITQKIGVQT